MQGKVERGFGLTGSSDGERALNGTKLLVGDERRVCVVANVDLAGLQEAVDVLSRDRK